MTISRRDWFRGLSLGAGSTLLSSVLTRLHAESAGAPAPTRFVFVVEGNGLNPDQIQPVGIERKKNAHSRNDNEGLSDIPLTDHALPEAIEPLKDFKDRLTIVQGLSGRVCGGGHSNDFGALGCYPHKRGAFDQTIDGALARALPSVFNHVGLGISDKPEHSVIYNVSASGPNQKLPVQCRPNLAYASLFGSVAEGTAREAFVAQGNLLDFMIDDIKRAERHLGTAERDKLDAYLHSYESMRDRRSRLNEIEHTLRKSAPVVNDKYRSDVETDRLDAQFDIAAASLIGGLSNVVTIASGAGNPYFSVKFNGLGIQIGKHSIGHGKGEGDRTWRDLAVTIRRFHMDLVARLARKLDAVLEGDGTMLDNTLIVYLSDAAEGHHSRCWEWPFVLLGNLGGRLRAGNRYLCYPRYGDAGHRTVRNLYNTFCHAAQAPRDDFGLIDPGLADLDQSGPLAELLA